MIITNFISLQTINQNKRLVTKIVLTFYSSLTISKIKSVEPIMQKSHDELLHVLKKNQNQIIDVIP